MELDHMLSGDVLEGRVALVTGAAGDIGRAVSEQLARLGAQVALVDQRGDELEALVSKGEPWGTSSTHATDLADPEKAEGLVPEVVGRHGRLDILVNVAGITHQGGLMDTSLADWNRVTNINLTAAFLLVAGAGRQLRSQGEGGAIVNVTSSAAFRTSPRAAAYAVSKAGLVGLTRIAAGELAPYDVNVNAVAPGLTRTGMALDVHGTDERMDELAKSGTVANLFGRVSEPFDVANVVVFLCLPLSRQITAQVVHASAGAVV